jgi:hypothetical protein
MADACPPDDWAKLEGAFTAADVQSLRKLGHIEKLSITKGPRITAKTSRALSTLASVTWLWLWCEITRTAMRHVIAIRGLRDLDILGMTGPGILEGFASAGSLERIRANFGMTEQDLLEICRCRSLREIGAQNARLTPPVFEALLGLPQLEALDLEATDFDDEMAEQISSSDRLASLDVGAGKLSRHGLTHICKMKQLRSLDLWATRIEQDDVELLRDLPRLEYLSIGDYEGGKRFDAELLLPRLIGMPSLKRVWLDGVALTPDQRAQLEVRFSSVRIT